MIWLFNLKEQVASNKIMLIKKIPSIEFNLSRGDCVYVNVRIYYFKNQELGSNKPRLVIVSAIWSMKRLVVPSSRGKPVQVRVTVFPNFEFLLRKSIYIDNWLFWWSFCKLINRCQSICRTCRYDASKGIEYIMWLWNTYYSFWSRGPLLLASLA